jgi:hypothetical protein
LALNDATRSTTTYSKKKVTLNPSRSTLTRLPEESNVDTSNGMPKKRSTIVSVPLSFTVSTPPNNESSNASKGGVFKDGGAGGAGGADGGGDGVGVGVGVGVAAAVVVVAWAETGVDCKLPRLSVATL